MLKWIKKRLPTQKKLKKNVFFRWAINWFGNRPYLWKFTKASVSMSVAISVFVAFLPLPFEMIIITALAILLRANLPIAFFSIWITNPFTLIPANYFSFKLGQWILQDHTATFTPLKKMTFDLHSLSTSLTEFFKWFGELSKPYFVGLPILSLGSAVLSYILIYGIWTGCEWFFIKVKRK